MSTPAVTQPNSASATEPVDDFTAFQEEANRRDIARAKGLPEPEVKKVEVKPEVEVPADTDDASAASSETAAASEAAPQQDKRTNKTQASSESRWAKITRENRELRERISAYEAAQTEKRDTQQASQPAKVETSPKPKFEDVDDKGQPKYPTWENYLDARELWARAETKRELAQEQAKTQKEAQQKQAFEVIQKEWGNRVTKAKEKYADYDAVALNPELPVKEGSVVDAFILDSAHGTDVLYHLGKNPQELTRINGLSPLGQARELTRIELKFSSPPAKRITSASPPPNTVDGTGTVGKDPVEQALKGDDFENYRATANARDLARLRGR